MQSKKLTYLSYYKMSSPSASQGSTYSYRAIPGVHLSHLCGQGGLRLFYRGPRSLPPRGPSWGSRSSGRSWGPLEVPLSSRVRGHLFFHLGCHRNSALVPGPLVFAFTVMQERNLPLSYKVSKLHYPSVGPSHLDCCDTFCTLMCLDFSLKFSFSVTNLLT